MHGRPAFAVFAGALALLAACSSASTGGGEAPAPTLWTFEEFAWYRWMNTVAMNSTVGPIIARQTVLFGGTYGYAVIGQETRTSRLALLDAATGQTRWRIEQAGTWGPIALHGGVVAAAIDPASGTRRWRARSTTDAVTAGDTVLFIDGQTLRAVAADTGAGRWALDLPAALAYPQSLQGDHLYVLGASSLGSVNIETRSLEWVAPLGRAPTAGIAAADGTLYVTTQSASGSYVFHAFAPATQKDRWSRALDSSSPVAPIVMGTLVATAANSSAESLVALSRSTGVVAWSARAGSVPVQPVLNGNVLYVAGQGPNRIYAFQAGTGTVLWSGRLWGWPMGMALTEDGTLLVGADNLTLYAYRTR